jgi:NADH-quinone oxidoreductase subunit J
MIAQNVFFSIFALLMIVSALKVVTTKNIVHAALWLVLVLAGVAAQFLLLGAEFIGVTQILVYIGAVIVLLLFGVMLTKASIGDEENINMSNRVIPAIIATLMFAVMSYSIIDSFRGEKLPTETVTNAATVSDSIFSDFIIPFEAVSVLLLAALIGAVVIARKEAA